MNWFHTTFTLVENGHPQRRCTVRTEHSIAAVKQSIKEYANEFSRNAAFGAVSIHFMEDFAEGSRFAGLQNPNHSIIEAE